MTRDDIIRMAREAGWMHDHDSETGFVAEAAVKFAALVIKPWVKQLEVERKRFQELNDIVAVGMQDARADEREACAKVCYELFDKTGLWVALQLSDKIRARGNK